MPKRHLHQTPVNRTLMSSHYPLALQSATAGLRVSSTCLSLSHGFAATSSHVHGPIPLVTLLTLHAVRLPMFHMEPLQPLYANLANCILLVCFRCCRVC